MNNQLFGWVVVTTLALVPGCVVEHNQATGYLTVDWTIASAKDPRDCRDYGVDAIDVFVTHPNGAVAGDFFEPCESFATTIDLAPGTYDASATLVDTQNNALTTTVDLGRFQIYGNDELMIPTDFPLSAFY